MKTPDPLMADIEAVLDFLSREQLATMLELCEGEEKEFFIGKFHELAQIVLNMPVTYQQEGVADPIVHLHYFYGGCDWYITEKDVGTAEENGQHQAFGMADIGYGGELGYISIVEVLQNGGELDLHFKPRPLSQVAK